MRSVAVRFLALGRADRRIIDNRMVHSHVALPLLVPFPLREIGWVIGVVGVIVVALPLLFSLPPSAVYKERRGTTAHERKDQRLGIYAIKKKGHHFRLCIQRVKQRYARPQHHLTKAEHQVA